MKTAGFNVIDFHFYLQAQAGRRNPDGIHWSPAINRLMTHITLTHLALTLRGSTALPGTLHSHTLNRNIESTRSNGIKSKWNYSNLRDLYQVNSNPCLAVIIQEIFPGISVSQSKVFLTGGCCCEEGSRLSFRPGVEPRLGLGIVTNLPISECNPGNEKLYEENKIICGDNSLLKKKMSFLLQLEVG